MNGLPTPQHYVATASAGYTGFRDMIVTAAKRWLNMTAASSTSTKELTDALWPAHLAQGTAIDIRKRMVDTLLKCASRELSMCARRGPAAGKAYGHVKRPWLWSAEPKADEKMEQLQAACAISGLPEHIFTGPVDLDADLAGYKAEQVRQTLVDCIGASAAGQFLAMRDRAAIADEIMGKTRVTIL